MYRNVFLRFAITNAQKKSRQLTLFSTTPTFLKKHSLATRVLLLILLCGLFFAVAETCVQLYLDYKTGLEDVKEQIELVRKSYLKSITKSVWNLEADEVSLQLDGALQLKNISYLKVIMENGETLAASGAVPAGKNFSEVYPLTYQQHGKKHSIGTLHIMASLKDLYQRLYDKILLIMVSRILITLFLSAIFLFIFQHYISRHLTKMASYTQNLNFSSLGNPLVLDRPVIQNRDPDELEKVVQALNEMQAHLQENITEIKNAQAALKESEAKYRSQFESSMDAILLLDPEQGYIDCNRAALQLFKAKDKSMFLKLTPADLSPEYQPGQVPSSEKAEQMVATAFEQGSNFYEWTHKRLDGKRFFASVLATRMNIGGRPVLQGTIRDITDYKRSQEALIQSEKMMSVGGLAAGMAQEINNPLAGMLQNAEVLFNRLTRPELPGNQQAAKKAGIPMDRVITYARERKVSDMVQAIRDSGIRMARLIENMLGFVRKSGDAFTFHDPGQILDKSLALAETDFDLKKHHDFKAINIQRSYDESVPKISCEISKIQQVFLNIFRNGAQEMNRAVTQAPAFFITTRFDKKSGMVEIKIADNGPGMSRKQQKRVFEPFYTTKPVGVGTGLGLSISYFIITENHGGEMHVESSPGKGACFIITLPVSQEEITP